MLNASTPARRRRLSRKPAADQQMQASQSPRGLGGILRSLPEGDMTISNHIYANRRVARLAAHILLRRGGARTYRFCAPRQVRDGRYRFQRTILLPHSADHYQLQHCPGRFLGAQDEIQDHGSAALDLAGFCPQVGYREHRRPPRVSGAMMECPRTLNHRLRNPLRGDDGFGWHAALPCGTSSTDAAIEILPSTSSHPS